jgi:hypothetical protein
MTETTRTTGDVLLQLAADLRENHVFGPRFSAMASRWFPWLTSVPVVD